jgi:hypothetical protein
MKEKILGDIKVMYIVAEDLEKVPVAFNKLEAKLPSTRGRKFYGSYHQGIYKACVEIHDGDNPTNMGLPTETIPGGKYASDKLDNWESHIPEINEKFMAMARQCIVDNSRPSIEFYRSMRELILYLPIE